MHTKKEFIQKIKDNEGIIYKVARIYSNNREDLKDLYQEIVYQLWKSYKTFNGESKFSTWMYRIALNTSISYLKKEKKQVNTVSIDSNLLSRIEQIDSLMEEQITLLYAHIKKLNIIEKGIILLHLEGKSYDEIASITGFTSTNIGTRLARIKQKLKNQIKKY
ncbi:MAG TPA: sigma-70 family RNA polymerase sigma factor [Flavobacteriia bacterium]|jgi:RNA polymerase sigma-70 factor (ECF subfamily)|nr:sigma-70 family RNA polymerase sigma factor [Flavobacteriia bacterium]